MNDIPLIEGDPENIKSLAERLGCSADVDPQQFLIERIFDGLGDLEPSEVVLLVIDNPTTDAEKDVISTKSNI